MSYSKQLAGLVDDLRAMVPSGVAPLALWMGTPKQAIYAWKTRGVSEKTALKDLLLAKGFTELRLVDMAGDESAFAQAILKAVAIRLTAGKQGVQS